MDELQRGAGTIDTRMPSVRPALEADQEAIRRIVRAARLNPFRLAWPAFVVAEEHGQIVGVGQIRRHRDGTRELASLAVIPAYQGNGIGGAMVEALLKGRSGPIFLYCMVQLVGYYERFGFRVVTAAELPPGMRRMYRLGQAALGLLNKISPGDLSLAAMRWPGASADAR